MDTTAGLYVLKFDIFQNTEFIYWQLQCYSLFVFEVIQDNLSKI